eukprot:16030478-Heterocapsa_arctica.AAC.1
MRWQLGRGSGCNEVDEHAFGFRRPLGRHLRPAWHRGDPARRWWDRGLLRGLGVHDLVLVTVARVVAHTFAHAVVRLSCGWLLVHFLRTRRRP